MARPRILLNLFHPHFDASRGSRILIEHVRQVPNLAFRNLYHEYPDFKIDVRREQQLLLDNDLIVFQHPLYWYSGPSLLKEWEDRVLEQGFAYPPGVGNRLNGKLWLSAITTGGAKDAYRSGGFNNYTISELLRPFQQTANLCGMVWLPPFVVHSVLPAGIAGFRNASDEEIGGQAQEYRAFLEGLTVG